MLTLGIESATDVCSVALLQGKELLGELSVDEPRSHASQLVPLAKKLLEYQGKSPADLDVIAVSAGPGSYTGLRIGASTAKGLAYAADAALVAVPTLKALAMGARPGQHQPILAVLPSRRGEVYAALYKVEPNGLTVLKEPETFELAGIAEWLPEGDVYILGPASQTVKEAVSEPDRLLAIDAAPSAAHVAALGFDRFKKGQTENVAAWEPYYLKAFVAKPPRPIFG